MNSISNEIDVRTQLQFRGTYRKSTYLPSANCMFDIDKQIGPLKLNPITLCSVRPFGTRVDHSDYKQCMITGFDKGYQLSNSNWTYPNKQYCNISINQYGHGNLILKYQIIIIMISCTFVKYFLRDKNRNVQYRNN